MDKIKAWVQDPKNMPIVVVGFVVIIGVAIFLAFRMNSAGKVPPAQVNMPGMPGAPGGPGTQMPGMPGGSPAGGPMSPMGGGPGTTVVASAPAATPAVAAQNSMLPYRKDPFIPFSGPRTGKGALRSIVANIQPYRLAPLPRPIKLWEAKGDEEGQVESIPTQPQRRMAGVMINGKISAILETDGESDIVVPGMEISRGGSRVRVETITHDEIILKTIDTQSPFTIKVNLAGSTVNPGGNPGGPAGRRRGPADGAVPLPAIMPIR
ncbi:MAG: hypothetical protein ACYC2Y_10880 [Armatimonadota bacterium]